MSMSGGPYDDEEGTRENHRIRGTIQHRQDQRQTEDRHLPHNRLTVAEIEYLREFIESDKRARWFWTSIRIWLGWLSGTMVALYAIWDQVEKFAKKITG